MITTLNVDGFKSLKEFEISFKKGLNVFIGPNGVGKTNVCQSLLLLSSLTNNSISDAFTKYGGVQSTFNIVGCDVDDRIIRLGAKGTTSRKYNDEDYEIQYNYNIKIILDDELIIDDESLEISRKYSKTGRFNKILEVRQSDNEIISTVLNNKLIGDFSIMKPGQTKLKISQIEAGESFLPLMSRIFLVCHMTSADFNKIKSFNIDPHVARLSCEISEPNEMLGNGKYLANTLNVMNKKSEDLTEINSILEQLLPNYKKIEPATSEVSLKRYFSLVDKDDHKFSSNSLSDGTIKLLATLVGIVRQKEKTTIIEEPENYLHPYASKLLISYLRDTFDDGVCILTTHSESILNQIRPEELIICELKKSFTKCHRLDNLKEIKTVIADSGFGCGYHYVTGNLGGVPSF